MNSPNLEDIYKAEKRIRTYIHKTPVMTSSYINSLIGADIYFKCENFQKVGAFKYRGALNAIFEIRQSRRVRGVTTHSSGNHAQALALAARMMDMKATIIMPDNAPEVKKNAVAGYGADIIFCEPTLEARESTLNKFVEESDATFIHPYNNIAVIAGQGTAALELIKAMGEPDVIMAPVGGGGLLSGTAITTKSLSGGANVIGCEPDGADDAYRSFYGTELFPSIYPNTICDGLLTSLGEINYKIIKSLVDEIITVKDDVIIEAMKLIWERMKIIVEPSAAVPLAVILDNKSKFISKKIGIILSGGNVDLTKLPW